MRSRLLLSLPCLLFSLSCAVPHREFRVRPATPNYLLGDPASHQTPFPDILRAYNGFQPGHPSVQLRPGMELRIENAYYQPGMSRRGLNGFLGTEVAQYKLSSRNGLQLLSVQSMKDRPSAEPPVQQLISPARQRQTSFRFYYEILFKRSGLSRGSVLLSADDESTLDGVAAELARDPDAVCAGASPHCTVFPEACSVSIEMEIVVNGTPRNVLWGVPLVVIISHPHHLQLWRLYHGHLVRVQLDPADVAALQLPLLPGDHVKWN